MGCCDPRLLARAVLRVAVTCIAGATAAGCGFHPLYGNATLAGSPGAATALATVEVNEIVAPNGSPLARIAFEVRNRLLFHLTGGAASAPPAYRLNITVSGAAESLIVDINSGRPDTQDYSLNATYTLTEIKSGRPVLASRAFAQVSYDIPGQAQRFARDRGQRDAEDRAAQLIADNIRGRLASFFTAGS
jgi:LPS-assembly lipoprotein